MLFWVGCAFLVVCKWILHLIAVILTGGQFGKWVDHEFDGYYKSEHWLHIRKKALNHCHHQCAVCGYAYEGKGRHLKVRHRHHYHDGKSVFHHEEVERDLIVLCEDHCQKGQRVREVGSWKSAYGWYGALVK